jgi:AmmeMemoRadiSam system protein A
MLNEADKAALLELARKTLLNHFNPGTLPAFKTESKDLLETKGAFVSLHREGQLRGCIGQLEPGRELFRIVQQCALSAALSDPRFPPMEEEELAGLDIEISVLTPFRRVLNTDEITVGKHGLYVVRGHCRGLLLPQVATEYGWDRIQFLNQTCHKAGLPGSAWQDPATEIYSFEAEVFSEARMRKGTA